MNENEKIYAVNMNENEKIYIDCKNQALKDHQILMSQFIILRKKIVALRLTIRGICNFLEDKIPQEIEIPLEPNKNAK